MGGGSWRRMDGRECRVGVEKSLFSSLFPSWPPLGLRSPPGSAPSDQTWPPGDAAYYANKAL